MAHSDPDKLWNIVLLGLADSGKTTILYRLKLGEIITTIPTIGFNVETIDVGSRKYSVRDAGGTEKLIPLWAHYIDENSVALIYVVDGTDPNLLTESAARLKETLKLLGYTNSPVLILLNKSDVQGSVGMAEAKIEMNLKDSMGDHPYMMIPCSAMEDIGLDTGVKWLGEQLDIILQNDPNTSTISVI